MKLFQIIAFGSKIGSTRTGCTDERKEKSMKKRFLTVMLVLMVALSALLVHAVFAADSGTEVSCTAIDGTAGNKNENYTNLFDGKNSSSSSSKWCISYFRSSTYVIIKAPNVIKLKSYTFITGNDTAKYPDRNPKSWTVYGSNDYCEYLKTGSWTTVHTVTDGKMPASNFASKSFTVNSSAAYRYYKICITEVASTSNTLLNNTLFQLCGMKFYGDANFKDYGIVFNGSVITSDNLSGNGWSYDPGTQVLTLGETGKSFTFNSNACLGIGCFNRYAFGDKMYQSRAIIQPTCDETQFLTVGAGVRLKDLDNPNRPQTLKIRIKGNVQLGDSSWWQEHSKENNYAQTTLRDQFGGIMWGGNVEITGDGTESSNLQIYSHAYGIKSNEIHFTDVSINTESYGNCLHLGTTFATNSKLTNKSLSLGGLYPDVDGNIMEDSHSVVYLGGARFEGSYLQAVGLYNRNNSTAPNRSYQSVSAIKTSGYRHIHLYNSTIDGRILIDSGWQLYCLGEDDKDYKGKNEIVGVDCGMIHLHDGSFVVATANGTNADVIFNGLQSAVTAYGNSNILATCSRGADGTRAISAVKWDDSAGALKGDFELDNTNCEFNSWFFEEHSGFPVIIDGVTWGKPSLSEYSLNVRFWKNDILYLREKDGKPQASWNRDFSGDVINLSSNTINPADYPAYDGKPCSVAVLSGEFNVILPKNPSCERYYIAHGGQLNAQMKDGANYGKIHLVGQLSDNYNVKLEGYGYVDVAYCEAVKGGFQPYSTMDCVYAHRQNGKLVNVTANDNIFWSGGSIVIDGGNIYECRLEPGKLSNYVHVNGGNVKNIVNSSWTKHVLDFNKIKDGTVDAKSGAVSCLAMSRNLANSDPFDGIYYIYTGNGDNCFNYVYVQSNNSYNYYAIPVIESSGERVVYYKFERSAEVWRYVPVNSSLGENKIVYVKQYESITLTDTGCFAKYAVIDKKTGFEGELFGGLNAKLGGTETRELPDGFSVMWDRLDVRTGKQEKVEWSGILDYTIDEATSDHEFYTYICDVLQRGEKYSESVGVAKIDLRVVPMPDVSSSQIPAMVGDKITLSASFDRNSRDSWRNRYSVGWQVDKGDGKGWVFFNEFRPSLTYELTIENEEMLSWKFRAVCYQLIQIYGSDLPENQSIEVTLRKRDAPGISWNYRSDQPISGESYSFMVSVSNGYVPPLSLYWEYSTDGGKTWVKTTEYSGFKFTNYEFVISGKYNSICGSYLSIDKLDNKMDGWQLRVAMYDSFQDKYHYSDSNTISLIKLPEIYIDSGETVTLLETDSSHTIPCWMFAAESSSNVVLTQQWQKKVKGSDEWIDIEGETNDELILLNLRDHAQTTYYRCKLTYHFSDNSHDDIIRYSKESTVNVVHAPAVNDEDLKDAILVDGWQVEFNIDFTANVDYPYSVQWQYSLDGVTWEDLGQSKLDTDPTCKKATFSGEENVGYKYIRAKVTCTIDDNSLDTCTKAIKLYSVKSSTISVDPADFVIGDNNSATITVTDHFSDELTVSYEWHWRKGNGDWHLVSELGFDRYSFVNTFTVGSDEAALADQWRCMAIISTRDNTASAQCITNVLSSEYRPTETAFVGYTLTLRSKIAVNFYMTLSKEFKNSENAYIKFSVNGSTVTLNVDQARIVKGDGVEYHVFTVPVSSHEMVCQIVAEAYLDGQKVAENSRSVRDYAMYIINNPDDYESEDVAFAKALLNYGAASQIYFDVMTDDLANKELDENDRQITQLTPDMLEKYKLTESGSGEIGTFTGSNLCLDSTTSLRAYFEPAEGVDVDKITFTVTVGGVRKDVNATLTANGYQIAYDDLMAYQLGDNVTFTAASGDQSVSFTCSAMTYAYNVISRVDAEGDEPLYTDELKTLMSALYDYMEASRTYGGTN